MGFLSQALTLQGKFEFHKLGVIWVVLAKVERPTTSGGEPGPTTHNKVQVAFLPAFLSRVFQLADEVSYLRLKQ